MNRDNVITETEQSTKELLDFFSSLNDHDFNNISLANGWTPGQVAEHILLLETQVNKTLPFAHKTERQPDLKAEPVRQGLSDLSRKFVAPEFIMPGKGDKNKDLIIANLAQQRQILKGYIESTDLNETVDYKHPVIGSMTRYEWVYFLIHHAQRHLAQMKQQISLLQ
jgi:hypothetical protein